MWIPWCLSAGDFANDHFLTVGYENQVPVYWIWQERQADGDFIRYSTSGSYENPATRIPGSSAVTGNRDCGLTLNGDGSLLLWEPDPATEVPWVPSNLIDEHHNWHMTHMEPAAGTGTEFLQFHRDFLVKFRDWYDRQHWSDPSLVAPWSALPSEFNQPQDPEAQRWFDEAHDLETNLYKWQDEDQFGTRIQFGGLHYWMHHVPITTVYRDVRITNFTTAPTSRYFYQLHGLINSWWQRWTDGRAAIVLDQSTVPSSLQVGQRFDVSVNVRNTGRFSWPSGGPNPVSLGSEDPQDNSTWGFSASSSRRGRALPGHPFVQHPSLGTHGSGEILVPVANGAGRAWVVRRTYSVSHDRCREPEGQRRQGSQGGQGRSEREGLREGERNVAKEKDVAKEREALTFGPPFTPGRPGALFGEADDVGNSGRRSFIEPAQRPAVGPAMPADED